MTVNYPILTTITFFPLVGVAVIMMINKEKVNVIRWTAAITAAIDLVLSLPLYFAFNGHSASMQFVETHKWIPALGATYHMGIDGISLFLVLLTTFLTLLSIMASWSIEKRVKEYMISFLLLEVAMIGVFCALDMLLFYLFWEAMLVPMFLLIGVWGGPRRIYAALKFFLYTMAGSVLMLAAIITLYYHHFKIAHKLTFDLLSLMSTPITGKLSLFLFLAFALAFAIKVPMFPFHTWLPDAHVEAPTAGSVILAGVLLKMGTYGFVRFCMPFFPFAVSKFAPIFLSLAVIGIIYGALVAMVQDDIKKLVAYSSVSHLGTCMLGIFALNAQSVAGGMMQMINHGLSTGALFLLVGMIYDRRHTRLIKEYGGIAKVMPIYATFFMIATFSSIGLPGLNGFIGEFLALLGAFQTYPVFAIFGATATILSACYMLWLYKRVFFHEVTVSANKKLKDLNLREIAIMVMIVVPMFWIGLYPKPLLSKMEPSINLFIAQAKAAKVTRVAHKRTLPKALQVALKDSGISKKGEM
jgi:NADH-quinone oxidoreductase subunit M